MGHSHSLSGAAAGLAAGILLHKTLQADVALSLLTAGGALLPDLDSKSSCASRCLGFISGVVSYPVRKLSGGHRHLCHSIAGVAILTALAWTACRFRHDLGGKIGLGLLIVIMVSGAIEALHVTGARSHASDAAGCVVAALVIWKGYGLALIPLAVAVGAATHILGDMLTVQGCPLADPLSQRHQFILPPGLRFTTDHWQERRVVVPVLFVVLGALAAYAIDPALLGTGVHAAISAL